jgi:hypothetical protein
MLNLTSVMPVKNIHDDGVLENSDVPLDAAEVMKVVLPLVKKG